MAVVRDVLEYALRAAASVVAVVAIGGVFFVVAAYVAPIVSDVARAARVAVARPPRSGASVVELGRPVKLDRIYELKAATRPPRRGSLTWRMSAATLDLLVAVAPRGDLVQAEVAGAALERPTNLLGLPIVLADDLPDRTVELVAVRW